MPYLFYFYFIKTVHPSFTVTGFCLKRRFAKRQQSQVNEIPYSWIHVFIKEIEDVLSYLCSVYFK